ncbi:hypothetical protein HU200_039833 [Digitaria exilis]|uniref:Uncharacterized protein n=1 Tax=Digitaria exilis TaxID=1010633 RepID=A0A835B795_9POAL|nr:hypothetical protein HU200_039833 [Digitaria exilis]
MRWSHFHAHLGIQRGARDLRLRHGGGGVEQGGQLDALPFSGGAAYVPEHRLWFGVRDGAFCAVDLAGAAFPTARRPPAVRNIWEDNLAGPPAEPIAVAPCAPGIRKVLHARFFTTDDDAPVWSVTHAVLTAIEVERCDGDDAGGGLRMVKHGTRRYTLLHDMMAWVL